MTPFPRRLQAARLVLREWQDSDREPFAAMNADARVMEYFPSVLPRTESDQAVARIEQHRAAHGFGFVGGRAPR